MKKKSVKTNIGKLIRQLGSKQAVAYTLGISLRQVYYLASGEKKASFAMAEYIRSLIK